MSAECSAFVSYLAGSAFLTRKGSMWLLSQAGSGGAQGSHAGWYWFPGPQLHTYWSGHQESKSPWAQIWYSPTDCTVSWRSAHAQLLTHREGSRALVKLTTFLHARSVKQGPCPQGTIKRKISLWLYHEPEVRILGPQLFPAIQNDVCTQAVKFLLYRTSYNPWEVDQNSPKQRI